MFIAALFTIAKVWEETKCPSMDEWLKMWYNAMEYYSAMPMQTLKLEIYMHTKSIQTILPCLRLCLLKDSRIRVI